MADVQKFLNNNFFELVDTEQPSTSEAWTMIPAQVKTNDELGVTDPQLTSAAIPNLLDQFDLSQYTLKLSIKQNNDPSATEERVLAQTGVTATQIDDLTINTLSNLTTGGIVNFKLLQPGHVTLMDDINRFRQELGLEYSVRPILFLEINFKGYTTDYEDNDLGGLPTHIAGPYLYKLFVSEIEITINESGSEYYITTIIHNAYANTNAVVEIPVLTCTTGISLFQACENLRVAIKDYYLLEKPEYLVQDEYIFNLTDPSLKLPKGHLLSAPLTGSPYDSTNDDYSGPGEDGIRTIEGTDGISLQSGKLTFRSGIKIDQFFLVLLSMSDAFKHEIARRSDPSDPSSPATPEKTFIKWFRILTDVEELEFDGYRKEYARKYTYTLKILDTARTDIGQEDEQPKAEQVGRRLKEMKDRGLLRKAYYYIFTGKNDQITNLDISFKSGAVLLNPPNSSGNPKYEYASILSNAPGESPQEKTAYAEAEKARIDYILALQAGDQEEIKSTGETFLRTQKEFKVITGKSFKGIYTVTDDEKPLPRQRVQSRTAPDMVQAGTYFGFSNTLFGFTAYQYHIASLGSSLVKLNMTIRGDPWYLGKRQWTGNAKTELVEKRIENGDLNDAYIDTKSGREACFYGDHTFFYLEFATPRVSLENYDDEDDDDGYWNFGNKNGEISQSFSGIYMLTAAKNTFSKGEFSCEIQAQLMTELSASNPSSETA